MARAPKIASSRRDKGAMVAIVCVGFIDVMFAIADNMDDAKVNCQRFVLTVAGIGQRLVENL